MSNPVVHFEIRRDAGKTQQFYRDLFGWTINADNPMNYGLVEAAEGGIGGGIGASPNVDRMVAVYVQVDDLQAALDRAVALGGSVVMEVTEIPGMVTFAMFADPDGNMIGLVKS